MSKFGLFSVTREYEVGIASNRGSACHGESVSEVCTYRPSRTGNCVCLKSYYTLSFLIIIDMFKTYFVKNNRLHKMIINIVTGLKL